MLPGERVVRHPGEELFLTAPEDQRHLVVASFLRGVAPRAVSLLHSVIAPTNTRASDANKIIEMRRLVDLSTAGGGASVITIHRGARGTAIYLR